jgi:hypothetical protein
MSAMMDAGCGRFLTKQSRVSWALSLACKASDCDVVLCIPSLRICCCTAVMPSFVLLAIFVFSRLRVRLARAPLANSNVFGLNGCIHCQCPVGLGFKMRFGKFGEVDFKEESTIAGYVLWGDFGEFIDQLKYLISLFVAEESICFVVEGDVPEDPL